MSCEEMIRQRERMLKRKLNKKEKRQIMEEHGHTDEEIAEELGEELIYA